MAVGRPARHPLASAHGRQSAHHGNAGMGARPSTAARVSKADRLRHLRTGIELSLPGREQHHGRVPEERKGHQGFVLDKPYDDREGHRQRRLRHQRPIPSAQNESADGQGALAMSASAKTNPRSTPAACDPQPPRPYDSAIFHPPSKTTPLIAVTTCRTAVFLHSLHAGPYPPLSLSAFMFGDSPAGQHARACTRPGVPLECSVLGAVLEDTGTSAGTSRSSGNPSAR